MLGAEDYEQGRYEEKKEKVVMIGDRSHDAEGAKQAGIVCLGVTYGYGTKEELLQAGAGEIAETVEGIEKVLEQM